MFQVADLTAAYGEAEVLRNISFNIRQGEIVTLIGPNGAGKSTILACILGLLKSWKGKITFDGKDLSLLEPEKIVNMGIAMVPEDRGLFPPLTVMENLLLGAYLRLKNRRNSGKNRQEVKADLEKIFELFPVLKTRLNQQVGTLSGGQQQMVAIGKALMAKPRLLFLDEPSLGLAPLVIREIFNVIETLNQNGVTILLIEQNANLALKTAHRGYVLENGRISLHGATADLLNHDDIKKAYLGYGC